jgi:hypothetical protein
MSAGLFNRDAQVGVEQAWHGKTKVVPVVTRELAHPFEVFPVQLQTVTGIPVKESILIASDDNLPVGKSFAKSYVPNTIAGFWDTLEQGLDGIPFDVESAGSIFDRSRIFASVKVDAGFSIGARQFNQFLTLVDSFDATTSLTALYNNVCVVCANTFAATLSAGNKIARAKHTKNFISNADKVKQAIEDYFAEAKAFETHARAMDAAPISADAARNLFAGLVSRDAKPLSTRASNTVDRLVTLFAKGAGNTGATRLDAFSAVTDYYSHESSGGDDRMKQFISGTYGAGATAKREAFAVLTSDDATLATTQRGARVLDLTASVASSLN